MTASLASAHISGTEHQICVRRSSTTRSWKMRRTAIAAAACGLAISASMAMVGVNPATASTTRLSNVHLVARARPIHVGHTTWRSDRSYAVGGHYRKASARVRRTSRPRLFSSERIGHFGYRIPVTPGWYRITVNTASLHHERAGHQVFVVSANGRPVFHHLDPAAAAGRLTAYTVTKNVRVLGSTLRLGFAPRRGRAAVSSVAVVGVRPLSGAPATSSPPTTDPPTGGTVSPEMYGAVGDGITDDTAALQQTFDNAAGRTVVLPAGHVYAHSGLLYLRVPGLHVTGPGTLLATNEQESSVWIEAAGVVVDGGMTIRTASTTQRWSTWDQMGVRVLAYSGVTLRDITVDGAAAAGIYVGGAFNFALDHVTVENSRADGIHMTDGAHNGSVRYPTVKNSGDDGVAVVSYLQDGTPCHDITVTSPTVLGTTGGRGISVVGGNRITETDIDVERSSAAGVYIAAEGDPWYTAAPTNVSVAGGRIVDANTDSTVDHGAIVVIAAGNNVAPKNISIRSLSIIGTRPTASRDIGVITYAAAPRNVLFSHLTITGGPTSAYSGNTDQSSYKLRSITQNSVRLPDAG